MAPLALPRAPARAPRRPPAPAARAQRPYRLRKPVFQPPRASNSRIRSSRLAVAASRWAESSAISSLSRSNPQLLRRVNVCDRMHRYTIRPPPAGRAISEGQDERDERVPRGAAAARVSGAGEALRRAALPAAVRARGAGDPRALQPGQGVSLEPDDGHRVGSLRPRALFEGDVRGGAPDLEPSRVGRLPGAHGEHRAVDPLLPGVGDARHGRQALPVLPAVGGGEASRGVSPARAAPWRLRGRSR